MFRWSLIAVVTLIALAAGSFLNQGAGEDSARSAALFMRFVPVLQHPRCINCHTSTDFPRQGDDGHRHVMQVRRGPTDRGVAALPCRTCHQVQNSPAGVPGIEGWHLAPLRMAWEGLTAAAICRSLTEPAQGGMTPAELIHHMSTDHIVLWAWNAGVDLNGAARQPPPMSHAAFSELVRTWVATGATCPRD